MSERYSFPVIDVLTIALSFNAVLIARNPMNTRIWLVALSLLALSLPSFADQPRMESALAALQEARAQLQNASVDKGGHRVKALRAVDQAIAEVKAGIAFDRAHQSRQENQRP